MFALQASRYVHDMLTYMPVFIGRSVRPFVLPSCMHVLVICTGHQVGVQPHPNIHRLQHVHAG